MTAKRRPTARVYRVIEKAGYPARVVYDTRLDRFLHDRNIPLMDLACASGHSRQHVLRLRSQQLEPTLGVIRRLTAGCIAITGDPTITPDDLFDVSPDADAIAEARRRDEMSHGPERRRDVALTGRSVRPRSSPPRRPRG